MATTQPSPEPSLQRCTHTALCQVLASLHLTSPALWPQAALESWKAEPLSEDHTSEKSRISQVVLL